jgi:5-methylcytosine-specific restriction enzyme subunit McrC
VGGKPVFEIQPDLAVCSGGRFPLLVDAKYKTLNPTASDADVGQDDFYQMFAYAHRYDCPRVLMLYPQTADMPTAVRREFILEGTNGKTIVAATVDVRDDVGSAKGRTQLVERLPAVRIESQPG